jgi:ferrous iron transport protein B
LLEQDDTALHLVDAGIVARAAELRGQVAERTGEDVDLHIADTRFGHAHVLARDAVRERGRVGRTLSDAIDRVVLSRWLGIPLFLAVMYLMFVFTINLGGAFIDVFDGVASALFVDGLGSC